MSYSRHRGSSPERVVCEQFVINPVSIIISCNVFQIKDGTIWQVEKRT